MQDETIFVGGRFQSAAEELFTPVPEQKHFTSKRLSEMTAEEVKATWQAEKPEEFEQTDPLYAMPLEDLFVKAEQERIAAEEKDLNDRQTRNAFTFMANEPRYKKTPKNGELMWEFITKHKMQGTVTDLAMAFDILSQKGLLDLNDIEPEPRKVHTEAELREMSAEQLKEVAEQAHRDGIW